MQSLHGIKKSIYLISFPLSFIAFIMPLYAAELGASIIEIGILYSIFSLCSIVVRPFVGRWIDKKGRKSGVMLGLISYTLVLLIFIVGNSYNYLLVARILQSMAGAFLWISLNAMVSDVSNDENRSKNFGDIEQVSNKGAMLGSFIGFTIIFNISIDNPFKIIFLIYLFISLVGVYYGLTKGQETLKVESNIETYEKPIDTKFKYFLAVMMILSLVGTMMAPMYLVYMREHITSDIGLISFLYIPGGILSLFLPKKFGALSDNYGRKKLLIAGMLIQAVIIFFMPIFKGYYTFMLAYTGLSIGGMLGAPARMSLVTELTGGINSGKSYGYYSTAVGLGGVIGPLIGASIYQYVGYSSLFYTQGFTILAALIIISLILREGYGNQVNVKAE